MHTEPRWPPVLAALALLVVVILVPGHLRVLSGWAPYLLTAVTIAPMIVVAVVKDSGPWLRAERLVTFTFGIVIICAQLGMVEVLVTRAIENDPRTTPMALLASSVVVWLANVIGFSFLYWQLDGGGPERRACERPANPDWQFMEMHGGAQRAAFVDYLYLAFSTATAFSATDTIPLSHRAKLLMMLEATIALLTMVVVAARAINVLGS